MRALSAVAQGRRGSPLPSLRGHKSQGRLRSFLAQLLRNGLCDFGGFCAFRGGARSHRQGCYERCLNEGKQTDRRAKQNPAPLPCCREFKRAGGKRAGGPIGAIEREAKARFRCGARCAAGRGGQFQPTVKSSRRSTRMGTRCYPRPRSRTASPLRDAADRILSAIFES